MKTVLLPFSRSTFLYSFTICISTLFCPSSSVGQQTVKVMHYNLLQFGNSCPPATVNQKVGWLNAILNYYQPDILTVNELAPQRAYAQNIRLNAFTYTDEIEFGEITNNANSQIVNALFYNSTLFGYKGVTVLDGGFRDINVYELYTQASVNLSTDTTFLYCIVAHFKAGSSNNDAAIRNKDSELISDWIEANPDKENILLMGDFNFGSANEDGFEELVENTNQAIRFIDPTGKINGWGGQTNAVIHTQSTRSTNLDCGSPGGLDDRFDLILARPALMEGTRGISYVSGSYAALGNDGTSYNSELNCNGEAVPIVICASLKQMSDHLPVVLELELEGEIPTSGIKSLSTSMFTVNNPVDNQLVIRWTERSHSGRQYQISLTDLLGKNVIIHKTSLRESELSVDISNLESGLYVILIKDRENSRVWGGKLVKR